jgi:signal transduction histidine kinase
MERRTLLIIDDSAEDRETLIRHLNCDPNFEYQIVQASLVQEGLGSLAESKPDCVVLDSSMADGDGLDFLRAARDERGRVLFPVVILTASGSQQKAVALMKAGAQDYLVKAEATADAIRLAVNNAIYKVLAERRLEEQRIELERLYHEARTNNDALRAANTAKDDFLATLSHELRTPLAPVLSIVSATLADTALTPDLRETLAMIQRNVELEARLIDDLLDLTQIASGRLSVDKRPVNVHRCIEAALEICQNGFEEKRISVTTDLAATQPMVLGEFARLNQIFWNLLKNAVKFTGPQGQVKIVTGNESGSLIVEIRDTGMGIEPDRLAGIFGAFNPLKPQPTATGLGLGLAITRAIVEAHGGEIRASSDGKGQGARFRICLPTTEATVAPADAPFTPTVGDGRGKRLLVVEDHEDTRRVLSRALRRKGYGVATAGTVETACEQFVGSPADLVICDIGLPDGSGWDLMEKLRPHGPVRAIAVSGYGMNHDVEKSREVGFLGHLTKPIDFLRLEQLIREILSAEQPTREPAKSDRV